MVEILLLVALVAVGASALFIAVTFNSRARQTTDPLIQRASQEIVNKVSAEFKEADGSLRSQLQWIRDNVRSQLNAIGDNLHSRLQEINRELSKNNALVGKLGERLDLMDRQISDIHNQLAVGREGIERLTEQFVRLDVSVSQLGGLVSGIESYLKSKIELTAADVITRLQESLRDLDERQSRTHTEVASMLERLLAASVQQADRNREASEQMLDMTETLWYGQRDIADYLRSRLDYEVIRTSRDHQGRIIAARLYLDRPGGDILWPLCLEFCQRLNFRTLLSTGPGHAGRGSYLICESSDSQLEEILTVTLATCRDSRAAPGSGLEEFRSLALVLHRVGPGTVQLGPMIVSRTPQSLLGCILTEAEMAHITGTNSLTSADVGETLLRQLGPDRVVDLTSWAEAVMLSAGESEAPRQPG